MKKIRKWSALDGLLLGEKQDVSNSVLLDDLSDFVLVDEYLECVGEFESAGDVENHSGVGDAALPKTLPKWILLGKGVNKLLLCLWVSVGSGERE